MTPEDIASCSPPAASPPPTSQSNQTKGAFGLLFLFWETKSMIVAFRREQHRCQAGKDRSPPYRFSPVGREIGKTRTWR